jgi:hypothetical protein
MGKMGVCSQKSSVWRKKSWFLAVVWTISAQPREGDQENWNSIKN